jgi:hypothetical protein
MYNEIEYYESDGYDEYSISDTEASTIDTNRINQKIINSQIKNMDSGYFKFKHKQLLDDGKYKNVNVEVYETKNYPGIYIRNAITGVIFPYKVGSTAEGLFFKVAHACGSRPNYRGPLTLFFDSPEQYERHMKGNVNKQVKEEWSSKFKKAKKLADKVEKPMRWINPFRIK